MSVCNLLKTLDKNGNNGQGTFFTFSQYAEDLTAQQSLNEHYRVVPSKFACLNITSNDAFPENSENAFIPKVLQNTYENKISYFRELSNYSYATGKTYTYNAFDASSLLWSALYDASIITKQSEQVGSQLKEYFSELKYIGDIDIYSNESLNGSNYTEIYCLIPPEAKEAKYYLTGDNTYNTFTAYNGTNSSTTKLHGWENNYPMDDQTPKNGIENSPEFDANTQYKYKFGYVYYPTLLGKTAPGDASNYMAINNDSNSFDFNIIVLFYDVYNTNGEIEARNLPLGIWFSGEYDSVGVANNKPLKNSVTKFVASDSIYGQGTSYGLRICTKLIATPFGTENEVTVDSTGDHYESIGALCEAFCETIEELDKVYAKINENQGNLADYVNDFTSGKVNVPYMKVVNNMWYWFVNGRNTGVPVCKVDSEGETQITPIVPNWDADADEPGYIDNKPDIPAEQIQSDWNQTNTGSKDYIKNKPEIEEADSNDDATPSFVTPAEKAEWNAKSVVSGENDGTNWTSLTVGSDTYAIPSGGGGGGTSNYNSLTSKPKINNIELSGNKTSNDLSLASSTHTHGNITNNGKIDGNDVSIANNDALLIADYSNNDTIVKSNITFDGSTTKKYLSKKGTWEQFNIYDIEPLESNTDFNLYGSYYIDSEGSIYSSTPITINSSVYDIYNNYSMGTGEPGDLFLNKLYKLVIPNTITISDTYQIGVDFSDFTGQTIKFLVINNSEYNQTIRFNIPQNDVGYFEANTFYDEHNTINELNIDPVSTNEGTTLYPCYLVTIQNIDGAYIFESKLFYKYIQS